MIESSPRSQLSNVSAISSVTAGPALLETIARAARSINYPAPQVYDISIEALREMAKPHLHVLVSLEEYETLQHSRDENESLQRQVNSLEASNAGLHAWVHSLQSAREPLEDELRDIRDWAQRQTFKAYQAAESRTHEHDVPGVVALPTGAFPALKIPAKLPLFIGAPRVMERIEVAASGRDEAVMNPVDWEGQIPLGILVELCREVACG